MNGRLRSVRVYERSQSTSHDVGPLVYFALCHFPASFDRRHQDININYNNSVFSFLRQLTT